MDTAQNGDTKPFAFKPCQKVRGGMAFYPITTGDQDVQFLLGPTGSFPATIPFEPNVFGGSGGEPRKAIKFYLSDRKTVELVYEIERKAKELLRYATKGDFKWNSAITEEREAYPASRKAKIWVSGERAANIRNQNGEQITMPGQPWQRPTDNAALTAKGVYHMANGQAGLVIQVIALHLGPRGATHDAYDPFDMV